MDRLKDILREYLPIKEKDWRWAIPLFLAFIAALALLVWNVFFAISVYQFDQVLKPWFIVKARFAGVEGSYGITGLMTFAVLGLLVLQLMRDYRLSGLHGRARWAGELSLKSSGLRDETGLLLGIKNGRYLCSDTEGFVFGYAPTGSGKSVGFVIPNLLNYPDSVIALDTKLELFKSTSGFRAKHGQQVFLWAPGYGEESEAGTERTHRFNPLDIVSRDPLYRVADLKRIAAILWPPSADGGEVWQPSARSLFTAMAMDLMDTGQHLTFGNLYRLFAQTPDIVGYLERQMERHFDPKDELILDTVELVAVNKFIAKASKERSGVISSFDAKMEVFEDPLVDAACSATDFDITLLRRKRITIYVGVNPSDLERLQPLLNLFFQLVITRLTKKEPDLKKEPYKLLLCLDEFPRLGKIEKIKEGVDYLRSYGFRVMIIAQSVSKLREIYGDHAAENYMQNFQYIVGYAPNSQKEAKEISDMLGKKTVRSVSKSHSLAGVSTTISLTGRELMTPDEVRRFSEDKEIIIVRNRHPVKARKIKWYKDKGLKDRICPPVDAPLLHARAFKAKSDREFNAKLQAALEEAAKKKDGAPPTDTPEAAKFSEEDNHRRLSILEGYF